jgi:hypothetical protein
MEQGIRLIFVKISEFRGGGGDLNPPNPPRNATGNSSPVGTEEETGTALKAVWIFWRRKE